MITIYAIWAVSIFVTLAMGFAGWFIFIDQRSVMVDDWKPLGWIFRILMGIGAIALIGMWYEVIQIMYSTGVW